MAAMNRLGLCLSLLIGSLLVSGSALAGQSRGVDVCGVYRAAVLAEGSCDPSTDDECDSSDGYDDACDAYEDCRDGSLIVIGAGETWAVPASPRWTLDRVANTKDLAFIECPWGYGEDASECQ